METKGFVLILLICASAALRADDGADAKAQCEAQPEIKALHFGARRDALKQCIDGIVAEKTAERKAAREAELAKMTPVHRYAVCTDRVTADAMAYESHLADEILAMGGTPPDTEFGKRVADMKGCLDTRMPDAIAQAKEGADLTKAVKDYYVAAQSLLDSITDDKAKRAVAGQSYDEASNRLHMEAAAAGKW